MEPQIDSSVDWGGGRFSRRRKETRTATTTRENVEDRMRLRQERRRLRAREAAELGCGHDTMRVTVQALHGMDLIWGVGLMIYGCALLLQSKPAPEALVLVFVFAGLLLLLTAGLGILGLAWNGFERCFLTLSGGLAALIGIGELVTLLTLLAARGRVLGYLHRHGDQLHLHADSMQRHIGKIVLGLLIMALAEFLRFLLLRKLRQDLLRYDEAEQHPGRRPRRYDNDFLGEPLLPQSTLEEEKEQQQPRSQGTGDQDAQVWAMDHQVDSSPESAEQIEQGLDDKQDRECSDDDCFRSVEGGDAHWWSGEEEQNKPQVNGTVNGPDLSWAEDGSP